MSPLAKMDAVELASVDFTDAEVTAFLDGYVTAALWVDSEELGVEVYDGHTVEDFREEFAPGVLDEIAETCAAFMVEMGEELDRAVHRSGYDWSNAGHDFLLSRNGHGAGYFDRGLGETGDKLQKAARVWGEESLYRGDDDMIRVQG